LQRSPAVLAIPGTTSFDHFQENLAAAAIPLTPEDLAAITAITD
jgi:aryl-alcohol dehydrogenase-like predicted oxidoreductase